MDINNFPKIITKLLDIFLVIVISALVIDTFFQVVNRFIFKLPISWTEEIARYLSIWMTLIGAARCVSRDTHMKVSILFDRFPQKLQNFLTAFRYLLTLWFVTVVIVQAFKILPLLKRQLAPASRISMFWVYLSGPVACILMVFFLLIILWRLFIGKENLYAQKGGIDE